MCRGEVEELEKANLRTHPLSHPSGFTSIPGSVQGQDSMILGRGEGLDSYPRPQENRWVLQQAQECSLQAGTREFQRWGDPFSLPLEQSGLGSAGQRTPPCGHMDWTHQQLEAFPGREHRLLNLSQYSLWSLSFINSLLQYYVLCSFGKAVLCLIRRRGCFGTPEN